MDNLLKLKLPSCEISIDLIKDDDLKRWSKITGDEIIEFLGYEIEIKFLNGVVVDTNKYFINHTSGRFSDGFGDVYTSYSELDQFFLLDKSDVEHSFRYWDLRLELRNSHAVTVIFDRNDLPLGVINHSIRKKFINLDTIRKSYKIAGDYPDNLILEQINLSIFNNKSGI